jgi:colicin import membrane protein
MSYQYEIDRPDTEAVETIAEDWITDENALNKKKTKLAKYTGKFRRKTIDRKDNIFETIKAELSK